MADKYGGARVTLVSFGGMIASTLGVLWTLSLLEPLPPPPSPEVLAAIKADPARSSSRSGRQRGRRNSDIFPLFLGCSS